MTWHWDPLMTAASAVSYFTSEGWKPNVIAFSFYIDRHPCDDQPYMADMALLGGGTSAHSEC